MFEENDEPVVSAGQRLFIAAKDAYFSELNQVYSVEVE
jgi:hypothetical protein